MKVRPYSESGDLEQKKRRNNFWKIYSLNFGHNFLSGRRAPPTSNAVASGSSSSLRRTDLSEGGRVGSQTWRTRGEDQVIQVVPFSCPIVGGHLTDLTIEKGHLL